MRTYQILVNSFGPFPDYNLIVPDEYGFMHAAVCFGLLHDPEPTEYDKKLMKYGEYPCKTIKIWHDHATLIVQTQKIKYKNSYLIDIFSAGYGYTINEDEIKDILKRKWTPKYRICRNNTPHLQCGIPKSILKKCSLIDLRPSHQT